MFLKDMKLRSHEIVIIDFDEASKAWRKNKIDIGNGCYKYKKNAFKLTNHNTNPVTSRRTRSNPINFIYS